VRSAGILPAHRWQARPLTASVSAGAAFCRPPLAAGGTAGRRRYARYVAAGCPHRQQRWRAFS